MYIFVRVKQSHEWRKKVGKKCKTNCLRRRARRKLDWFPLTWQVRTPAPTTTMAAATCACTAHRPKAPSAPAPWGWNWSATAQSASSPRPSSSSPPSPTSTASPWKPATTTSPSPSKGWRRRWPSILISRIIASTWRMCGQRLVCLIVCSFNRENQASGFEGHFVVVWRNRLNVFAI